MSAAALEIRDELTSLGSGSASPCNTRSRTEFPPPRWFAARLAGCWAILMTAGRKTPKSLSRSSSAAQELIGFDGFLTLVDLSVEAEDFGQEVIFPERSTAFPNFDNPFIVTAEDYSKVRPVDPRKSRRMSAVIEIVRGLVEAKGKEVPTMGFVYGPLGVLSQIRGHAELFKDIIRHPDRVLEAVHTINDVLVDYALAQVQAGAHAIVLDPLYSLGQHSEEIHRAKFEAEISNPSRTPFATPAFRSSSTIAAAASISMPCSSTSSPSPSRMPIPPTAPPIGRSTQQTGRRRWSPSACPTRRRPAMNSPRADVLEDCRHQIETFKIAEGGFILSSGCEYPPNGNLLSARTMVQAAKLYGRY